MIGGASKDLSSHHNLPTYKSIKTDVKKPSELRENSAKRSKFGGSSDNMTPSGRGEMKAAPIKTMHLGLKSDRSKKDLETKSQTNQPRQVAVKKNSLSRPGNAGYNKGNQPSGSSTGSKGRGYSDRPDMQDYSLKGTHMDMMDASAKFTKSNIRNDDICNELVLSKEGMRFDQKERELEARKRK